jgi:nuclear GTP-binding protein
VWQYITLMKRIYLIDCPGVVPPSQTDTPQDILLRGVVRVENVENPEQYIPAVLAKTKPQHMERTYQLKGYKDHIEFLELLARKGGRLLHGGEPDVDGVAKMVLNDFLRGKIPWYTPAPFVEGEEGQKKEGVEGRAGRLGEMGKKRKRDDATSTAATSVVDEDESEIEAPSDEDSEVEAPSDDESGVEEGAGGWETASDEEVSGDEEEDDDDQEDDNDSFEGFDSDGGVDLDSSDLQDAAEEQLKNEMSRANGESIQETKSKKKKTKNKA